MKSKDSPWILERTMITSKIENQSVSTTTSIAIWPKNARRRKKKKPGSVSNVIKKDI